VAATRGPVPKRTAERRRRNKTDGEEVTTAVVDARKVVEAPPLALKVTWGGAEVEPHPIAVEWYESLKTSGQAQFFEPSDWQVARFVAHEMTRHLLSIKGSAMGFAALMAAMSELLTTEGSRRRVRLEIERGDGEQPVAGVIKLADYADAFGG